MTHITLSKTTKAPPSLEFYSDGSGEARRVAIEKFPFRIGRSEAADLRVDAVEVSREHAEIVERNGMWLVRDLGSTNGTQVNGRVIKETLLADGDILKIAATEITFVASAASQFQRMVTQPIQSHKAAAAPSSLAPEVFASRRLIEATLWQAIPMQLLAVTSLRHGGAEALFSPLAAIKPAHTIFDHPHIVCERYRELDRMRVIKLASDETDTNRLLLAVGATEIEAPHRLFSSLKSLLELTPSGWELGITISLPIDVDILRISQLYRQARDQGLLVAFDEFQGNGGQVMHLESLLPDYLVLSPSMTKDLSSTRQSLRRLESLLAACNELAIKPVLPQGEDAHVVALCQELGFDLLLKPATHRMVEKRGRQGEGEKGKRDTAVDESPWPLVSLSPCLPVSPSPRLPLSPSPPLPVSLPSLHT